MAGDMELILIRHTRCDIAEGTCYGRLDVPLAQTSADDIAHTLAQTPRVGLIFSSPSRRCHELALALAKRDTCSIRPLPDLMELNFGEWEGKRWSEVPRELSDPWAEDPWHLAPPSGESESDLWTRVQRAATELQNAATPRIAVVSHGGPLRLLQCLLTGTPVEQRWSRSIAWGGVVRIECTSQFLVTAQRESACPSSDP
jgi:alpha-ribazole phosphatase